MGAPPFSRTHTPRLSGFFFSFFFLLTFPSLSLPPTHTHANGFLWKSLECRRGKMTSQRQGQPFLPVCDLINGATAFLPKESHTTRCLHCAFIAHISTWCGQVFPWLGQKKPKKKLVRNFWNKKKTQTQSCRKQTRVVNHDADSRW